ncbi:alpha/beta fold hydrolase [Streptomyces sp. HD]|uniref:alpha/beta fold hydrolase n=1 Tax=Streptomyces sp. HD TaxID=3020892 RepID=UPI00232E658A|nr:alpha/beta hydrolase [Streptomyces sp. HD]MDC0773445.1 alpha/beta hydrolase [Streptomyces sp. HD]
MAWTQRMVVRDGVRLACRDWGESGRPVVLLHGLAGHAGEWDELARRLSPRYRVVAVDQRGHGAAERHPEDVSRAAHVADVIAVMDQLALRRPVLVGQSLGGHTAMLTAAAHPGLVGALVLTGGPVPWGEALRARALRRRVPPGQALRGRVPARVTTPAPPLATHPRTLVRSRTVRRDRPASPAPPPPVAPPSPARPAPRPRRPGGGGRRGRGRARWCGCRSPRRGGTPPGPCSGASRGAARPPARTGRGGTRPGRSGGVRRPRSRTGTSRRTGRPPPAPRPPPSGARPGGGPGRSGSGRPAVRGSGAEGCRGGCGRRGRGGWGGRGPRPRARASPPPCRRRRPGPAPRTGAVAGRSPGGVPPGGTPRPGPGSVRRRPSSPPSRTTVRRREVGRRTTHSPSPGRGRRGTPRRRNAGRARPPRSRRGRAGGGRS